MSLLNPATDQHGVTIRSGKYPLAVGDSFQLHSNQVQGVSGGAAHYLMPGRYEIVELTNNATTAVMVKITGAPAVWVAEVRQIFAILQFAILARSRLPPATAGVIALAVFLLDTSEHTAMLCTVAARVAAPVLPAGRS